MMMLGKIVFVVVCWKLVCMGCSVCCGECEGS